MSSNIIELPYKYYPDPTKGKPVYLGYIYIGEPNTDPEVLINQKVVTMTGSCVCPDEGTEISQPIRTSAGGVAVFNGDPVVLRTAGNYSIKVLNSKGDQVYYAGNVSDSAFDRVFNMATLAAAKENPKAAAGDSANLAEHTTGNGGGAMWDYVLLTSVTVNPYDTFACTGVPTLALVLRDKPVKSLSEYGVIAGGDVGPTLNFIYNKTPQAVVKVPFNVVRYVCDEMVDIRSGTLLGDGSGAIGQPQSTIEFSGTNGIFSSTPNNHGFQIRRLELYGSAAKTANGQTLIDFTGQNYPYLEDVRCWSAQYGVRLAASASVECNYGNFYRLDCNQCLNGIDIKFESPARSNSHSFHGGRLWDNNKGIEIPDGHSNISFHGTAFESNDFAGVDSEGNAVSFHGCRWENPNAINIKVRANAGDHFSFGDHFSSGNDVEDDTEKGVVQVYGTALSSVLPTSHLGRATQDPINLVQNGVFTYDNNGDGVPEPWIRSFSVSATDTIDMTGDVVSGTQSVKIVNTDSGGLRLFQTVPVVVGEEYTVTFRAKAVSGACNMRLSSNASSGTQYGNFPIPATDYRLLSRRLTATTDTLYISFYISGTDPAEVHVDMVTVAQGGTGSTAGTNGAVKENGALMQGDFEMTTGADLIAQSPDGTRYKLSIPNGGGAATWVVA